MSKIKVGVIGVGNITNEHIQGYLRNPDVELYAFCDINETQLKKQGEKYGVTRLYTDAAEMLRDGNTYNEIAEKTHLSTATITRVNRALRYGSDGYAMVLDRIGE